MKKGGHHCLLENIEIKDSNRQQKCHSCLCCVPMRVIAWRELFSITGKYNMAGESALEVISSEFRGSYWLSPLLMAQQCLLLCRYVGKVWEKTVTDETVSAKNGRSSQSLVETVFVWWKHLQEIKEINCPANTSYNHWLSPEYMLCLGNKPEVP